VVDVARRAYNDISHRLNSRLLKYILIAPLLALLTGSLVYCILAMGGALQYLLSGTRRLTQYPAVSVLRPLAGAQDNTEANLRSVFSQCYSGFEVLLGIHEESDPAAVIARRVMAGFPKISARLIVTGVSPLPNAKVWSLRALLAEARFENVVMTDSDIWLAPNCLETVIAELAGRNVALVTCPYRAAGGSRFWPRLEAIGLNTDFLAGMLTQRMLNGMDFAVGCTIATRKTELSAIGGLEFLQRYLAEDFMMGNLMRRNGREVVLSRSVIEHHIGNDRFLDNWKHRLRWARSTRRSRPLGYIGEIFTKPVALALLTVAVQPALWPLLIPTVLLRGGVAWFTAFRILRDPGIRRRWWLLPVEDVAGFITWVLGFFGKRILWRGRWLVVARDGSFEE
jgi:ceramide glucosyltransferase